MTGMSPMLALKQSVLAMKDKKEYMKVDRYEQDKAVRVSTEVQSLESSGVSKIRRIGG